MSTSDCLIKGHPIAPHHHAIGEGMRMVAYGCDFWEDNACRCSDALGPVFVGVTPSDVMNAVQDFHPAEEPPAADVRRETSTHPYVESQARAVNYTAAAYGEEDTMTRASLNGLVNTQGSVGDSTDPWKVRYEDMQREAQKLGEQIDKRVAEVRNLKAAEARVRVLHQPKRDSAYSLITHEYCSCGAMEVFIDTDGYSSIGPASYPCATIRALDES